MEVSHDRVIKKGCGPHIGPEEVALPELDSARITIRKARGSTKALREEQLQRIGPGMMGADQLRVKLTSTPDNGHH